MPTDDPFYRETRYCPRCRAYVQFLSSPTSAHCVRCDGPVRLFSERDLADFRAQCRGPDPDDGLRRA